MKAIEGAALIGSAALMEVGAAMYDPWLLASPMYQHVALGLALGGAALEAGAIASALTSNRGMNITTRQAAAARQVVWGTQRIGGVTVYESTTGSSHDQYNYVIVLAGHEIEAIENLYLDGRQVFWQGSGAGWCVRNGVGFGGIADGANHTGPDGVQYNFGGTGHSGLYCEARFGDQTDPFGTNSPGVATWTGTPTSVIGALTANDPNWASNGTVAPWVAGCAYIYLKIEANPAVFPAPPEIRVTIRGKRVFDPRTSTTAFSNNWALIAADVLTDTTFGLGDSSVNQAQLIAAANVCDEQVEVAALSAITPTYESRYCTDWHTDTMTGPGDILATMMPGAAGRISRIGGEWYVWPAYWQGPSSTWNENALTAAPQWKPYRSIRDLYNRVRGTYCAPNYPYSVAGNTYDANGFYAGMIQNNFPFAFQQTNYPEYACDVLHGYSSDQYLAADGGRQLVKELGLQTVLSVTQAQRVAKITLLRNRQQGSGTLTMGLPAYSIQPCDTMQFTFPEFGWTDKTLEVTSVGFQCEQQSTGANGEKAMAITLNVGVIEADQSVYEWTPASEELGVYDVPAIPTQQNRTPNPPTSMSLTSGAGTALVAPDGTVHSRIEVQWVSPLDVLTTEIQVEYQWAPGGVASGPWITSSFVDAALNLAYISNVVAGQQYNVRIRSVRPSGAFSTWAEIDDYTVSLTLSVLSAAAAAGSLSAVAYSDGTAAIFGTPFRNGIGAISVLVAPNNYPLAGLGQSVTYWVYYIDPAFTGGSVAAIATQTPADFQNKVGFYLIGQIQTPVYGGSVITNGAWYPSTFADMQDGAAQATVNPDAPIDRDPTVSAALTGSYWSIGSGGPYSQVDCEVIYSGWPVIVPVPGPGISGTAVTLYVSPGTSAASVTGAGGTWTVSVSLDAGSTWTAISTDVITAAGLPSVVTWAVTPGTSLDQLQVKINVSPATSGSATGPGLVNQLQVEVVDVVVANMPL